MSKFKQIQLNNLDELFKDTKFYPKPNLGWIKTIRNALSMPLSFPAKRLNVSPQSISQLEKGEIEETITLKSLRQLAESIDCELHYTIIPHKKSLCKMIEKQAHNKAKIMVDEVNQTMLLEDQKIKNHKNSVQILAKEFSDNPTKDLWSIDED